MKGESAYAATCPAEGEALHHRAKSRLWSHPIMMKMLGFPSGIRSWFERRHARTFQQIRNVLLEMYAEKRSRASFDAAALALPKEAVLTFEEEEKCIGELQDKDTLLGVFGAEKFVFMEENEPPLPPLRVELVAVVNQKI